MGLFSSRRQGPQTSGRIVTIPASGTAFVVSDLHGHQGDFQAVLERTRIVERLRAGEDCYLIITGDVPDLERHRAIDPEVATDGDVRILDRLIEIEKDLGARGDRIVYLEGNHDFHVLRIAREVESFDARRKDRALPRSGYKAIDPKVLAEYFQHYRETFGDDVFENNITPYDMIHRVETRHLDYLDRQPILAVLEGATALVTHAGPPKMGLASKRAVRKEIETATRDELGATTAEAYYSSAYHQLLNNRFRAKDYDLVDVDEFLKVFSSSLLITGHTPHPYLVDFAKQGPLEGCDFRDGLGFVGKKQVVLCTSFGAFDNSRKRYIELDLTRPYSGVDDLRHAKEICALYPDAPPPEAGLDETAQVIRALAKKHLAEEPRSTARFDPMALTEDAETRDD
ncbi:metallophosphoesterase [bacterium]|nr:metallophosphoesterase [bacterium]